MYHVYSPKGPSGEYSVSVTVLVPVIWPWNALPGPLLWPVCKSGSGILEYPSVLLL